MLQGCQGCWAKCWACAAASPCTDATMGRADGTVMPAASSKRFPAGASMLPSLHKQSQYQTADKGDQPLQ